MKSQTNLLVITHRRSGTHLTIDAIRNNFAMWRQKEYMVLETLSDRHPEHVPLPVFESKLESGCRVIKTHYPQEQLEDLARETSLESSLNPSFRLYVVRNCFDVMASLYEFRKGHDPSVRSLSFSDFLREPTFDTVAGPMNKPAYWAHHVNSWLGSNSNRPTVIRFEDWLQDYKSTLKRVGRLTGCRTDWFGKDIRISQGRDHDSKILRTWVEPRKGQMHDFVNYFSASDFDFVWDHCGSSMNLAGYDYDSLRRMITTTAAA